MNMTSIELVIFDLDGTLVDSVPDLAWSADRTLEELGLPLIGIAKTRDYVGNGLETFVKRFLTQKMNAEPECLLFNKAMRVFDEYYTDNVAQFSRLYEGVRLSLDRLQACGIKMALASNKAEKHAHNLLQELQIETYFEVVVGGDTVAIKKPDPMALFYAAKRCHVPITRCIMVGDSRHDIDAAKLAGMQVVAVPYGYNHGADIADFQPDFIVDSLVELPNLLKSL